MRILMLGNSFTFSNNMPKMLSELTGAEVIHRTRGEARPSEQLNPNTKLGGRTQAALRNEQWDYVVLQEMSHGPITSLKSFFSSVEQLCRQIRANGAAPILFATWAYQRGGSKLTAKNWDYDEMAQKMSEAYHKAARENNTLIADVGRRFYELSDTQNLYAADGVHPNTLGSCVATETLTAGPLHPANTGRRYLARASAECPDSLCSSRAVPDLGPETDRPIPFLPGDSRDTGGVRGTGWTPLSLILLFPVGPHPPATDGHPGLPGGFGLPGRSGPHPAPEVSPTGKGAPVQTKPGGKPLCVFVSFSCPGALLPTGD